MPRYPVCALSGSPTIPVHITLGTPAFKNRRSAKDLLLRVIKRIGQEVDCELATTASAFDPECVAALSKIAHFNNVLNNSNALLELESTDLRWNKNKAA